VCVCVCFSHFVPAHSTTVSTVHQENGSESSGHSQVRRLSDQNHDGLHELQQQHTRLNKEKPQHEQCAATDAESKEVQPAHSRRTSFPQRTGPCESIRPPEGASDHLTENIHPHDLVLLPAQTACAKSGVCRTFPEGVTALYISATRGDTERLLNASNGTIPGGAERPQTHG